MAARDIGWLPDATGLKKPKHRYDAVGAERAAPQHAEVPGWKWQVYPPRDLQACAASAIAGAIQLATPERMRPSVPFIYYAGRYLQLREGSDSGTSIYHALRACFSFGFCADGDWPLERVEGAQQRPSPEAEAAARDNGILEFRHIRPSLDQLRACIYRDERPFMFGAHVDDAFLDGDFDNDNIVRVPRGTSADNPHRHCLLAVRYEDTPDDEASGGGYFWVRDSIAPDRGKDGYLRIPYRYLVPPPGEPQLADDFWVITRLSIGEDGHRAALRQKREAYWGEARDFAALVGETYRHVTQRRLADASPQFPPSLSGR